MATTKTIQATVKNRTDTAANWTQKNPVLAEGEIIVVQTSAGETRLKIGDGVKTFTQLPYTDEQIYNNVVTSVNGQTGDVTLDIPGGGADWAQNNPDGDGYVKNRPGGYMTDPVITDIDTLTITSAKDEGGIYFAAVAVESSTITLSDYAIGDSVIVDFGGQSYSLTWQSIEGMPACGATVTGEAPDWSSAPFCIMAVFQQEGGLRGYYVYLQNAVTSPIQVKLTMAKQTPVKIPEKYLDLDSAKSLGLASAAIGQIPKIKAVDSNGVPTEWEAADMASGADGKSAYAYAVEGGYTGTEEEFAAKLAEEIPTVDDTLTQSGQAADASVVGNRLSALSEEIVTTSESKVAAHNTGTDTHSDIRLLIQGLTDRLNALADSDDTTLDQLSEVVAYIKSNRSLIEAITTSKVSVADIIDNLTTNVSNKPLSAAQGVALKALIDAISIPDALPNPNTLTFTGAVTSTYDGSEPVTINIPENGIGNMKKLTFTGAVTGEYDGTTDVNVDIPIATTSTAGTIKVGNGLSISADGTLSVTTATYYTGTADPVNTLGADGDLYLKTEG